LVGVRKSTRCNRSQYVKGKGEGEKKKGSFRVIQSFAKQRRETEKTDSNFPERSKKGPPNVHNQGGGGVFFGFGQEGPGKTPKEGRKKKRTGRPSKLELGSRGEICNKGPKTYSKKGGPKSNAMGHAPPLFDLKKKNGGKGNIHHPTGLPPKKTTEKDL